MNKRKFSTWCLLFVSILFLFSGIVSASESSVVIALQSEPSKLNPVTYQDSYTGVVLRAICDPLIEIDINGEYTTDGSVLEDYTIKEEGKIYIFKIRKGITFHNGEKLTAEDVKFTYESLMDENLASPHRGYYTGIEKLELLDDYTLKITLKKPNAIFLSTARLKDLVLPKDYIERVGWDGYEKKPIGSGPYKFVEHIPGQKIVLEKYENYWDKVADIEKVEFKFFPETASAVMALQTKEIDFLDLSPEDYIRLKENKNSGLEFGKYKEFADARICFNKREDSIFSDVRLRKAVAYAINRKEITSLSPGSLVSPAVGRIPSFHPAFSDDVEAYPYNPEKAKQLMAEAGYPDGFKTKLYVPSGHTQKVLEAQVIQQQLAKVGIDCEVVTLEWGTYLDVTAEGEAPMFRENWPSISIPEPFTFVAVWHSESSWNSVFGTYINSEMDNIIDQIERTPETSKRWELYHQAQKIAMDDVTCYPLYWPVKLQGYNDEIYIPEDLFNVFKKPEYHINEWSIK